MLEKFVATIVKFSHIKRSPKNKILMMLFGAINLLVVIPFVFFQVGCVLEEYMDCTPAVRQIGLEQSARVYGF
jgi:hypothetical protein